MVTFSRLCYFQSENQMMCHILSPVWTISGPWKRQQFIAVQTNIHDTSHQTHAQCPSPNKTITQGKTWDYAGKNNFNIFKI